MQVTKDVILRAWKDESYRQELPEDVRNAIPARPTGDGGHELSDAELEQAAGGTTPVVAGIAGAIAGGFGVGIELEQISDHK